MCSILCGGSRLIAISISQCLTAWSIETFKTKYQMHFALLGATQENIHAVIEGQNVQKQQFVLRVSPLMLVLEKRIDWGGNCSEGSRKNAVLFADFFFAGKGVQYFKICKFPAKVPKVRPLTSILICLQEFVSL